MNRLLFSIKNSGFFDVFNLKDDDAKGRVCIISAGILATIYTAMTAGVFYTGFLLANGIDMVNIGFVGSIPLFTSLFSLFSPMVLNRFKKRKRVLMITRMLFYVVNIGGITILPLLGLSADAKYVALIFIIFFSTAMNGIFSPAYAVWHVNFLPNHIRARFFSFQQIINGVVSAVVALGAGVITDAVSASGDQLQVIMALRFVALGLALFEAVVLSIPKEFEYQTSSEKTSFLSIFKDSFKYKRFLMTMLITAAWPFVVYLGATAFDVYVLNELKVSYTVINTVNSIYCVFIIVLSPLWRKYVATHSWFSMLAISLIGYGPLYCINIFLSPANQAFLYPMIRILQHMTGVGAALAMSNMPYINLPEKDRTSCFSFYALTANLGGLLGQICGTSFIAATKDIHFNLFGLPWIAIDNVKMILFIEGVVFMTFGLLVWKNIKKLEPVEE